MKKYLEGFLDCYIKKRDLNATLSYFTEDIVSIGTGEHEIGRNKAEVKKLLEDEFASLPFAFEYEMSDYTEISITEDVRNFFANVHIWIFMENEQSEMKTRLTGTYVKCGEIWKIPSVHMSTASVNQEENTFFPLHFGSRAKGVLSEKTETTLMELIAETFPSGIMGGFLEKDFPLYTINDKMLKILGYTYEEMLAATGEKMINIIYEDDREWVEREIYEQFREKGEYEIQYRAVGKGGRIILVNDIGKKIVSESGRDALLSVITDITEQAERERLLYEEATRDSLTQLYNRKQIRKLIEDSFREGSGGVLYICDIDRFKFVNDTRGHVAGDDVLRRLSAIMRKHAEESAILGRLGGDEFILYFPRNVEIEESKRIMESIRDEFCAVMNQFVPGLNVSLSVGGAVRKDENLDTLYSRADQLLYQAKQNRGDFKMV